MIRVKEHTTKPTSFHFLFHPHFILMIMYNEHNNMTWNLTCVYKTYVPDMNREKPIGVGKQHMG